MRREQRGSGNSFADFLSDRLERGDAAQAEPDNNRYYAQSPSAHPTGVQER